MTDVGDMVSAAEPDRSDPRPTHRIRAAVILAGVSGRLADVRTALGRNLFDLPSASGRSLLTAWHDRLDALVAPLGTPVVVRLAIDQAAPDPLFVSDSTSCPIELARDANPTRGTAGVLRDVTRDLADEDDVLVVQASDLAWEWSEADARALLESDAEIVLSADRDLRPAGPIRVRSGLLRRIPSIGFVDLKEQFLPRCAHSAEIAVVRSVRRRAGTLHSLRSYLETIAPPDRPPDRSNLVETAEPWRADRACVEPGAEVAATSVLFDSVVLCGARVEKDAVVVRSLIGPGVVVAAGEQIVDRTLVTGGRSREVIW